MQTLRSIQVQATKEFPLPVTKVWDLLSRTELLHDALGLLRVRYEDYPEGAYFFFRRARPAGLLGKLLAWREYPYEWVRGHHIRLLREFESGPLLKYERMIELEATAQGTRVKVICKVVLRWRWLAPLIKWRGKKWAAGVHRYCEKFFATWIQQQQYVRPRRTRNVLKRTNWERQLSQFTASTEHGNSILERLKNYLTDATDYEVSQMQPKALADRWGVDPYQVVRLFLYATSQGLMRMRWTLLDDHSKLRYFQFDGLSKVPSTFHSHESQKDAPVVLDKNLELRFCVDPEIREVKDLGTWEAGPGQQPEVLAQQYVPAGGVWVCPLELGEQKFRLRTLRTNLVCKLNPMTRRSTKPTSIQAVFQGSEWLTKDILFRPGQQQLEIENRSQTPIYAIVESEKSVGTQLMASELLSFVEFHHLFPHEQPLPGRKWILDKGVYFSVSLVDSTAYFQEVGDRKAINRIHHLLAMISSVVYADKGTVWKIMGDSLFGVFNRESDAVKTAFEVMKRMVVFNEENQLKPPFKLRVSIHHGPAIAVYRNGKMDLLGEAVNQLFKMNKNGTGENLILSESVFKNPLVQQLLAEYTFQTEVVEASGFSYVSLLPGQAAPSVTKVSK